MFRLVPESPRWLLLRGHVENADETVHHIAKINGKDLPKEFDVSEYIVGIEMDFVLFFQCSTIKAITSFNDQH